MKNGKYGTFITAAVLLFVASVLFMIAIPVCLDLIVEFAEGIDADAAVEEAGGLGGLAVVGYTVTAVIFTVIVFCLILSAAFVFSIVGLVFSRRAAKNSEKTVFRAFSAVFTALHIQGIVLSSAPAAAMTLVVIFFIFSIFS